MERHYSMSIVWSDEDKEYVATSPEFGPTVSALAKTAQKAARELELLLPDIIQIYESDNSLELPVPRRVAHHSGKFALRVGRDLGSRIVTEAEQRDLSINQFLLSVISHGLGIAAKRSDKQRGSQIEVRPTREISFGSKKDSSRYRVKGDQ